MDTQLREAIRRSLQEVTIDDVDVAKPENVENGNENGVYEENEKKDAEKKDNAEDECKNIQEQVKHDVEQEDDKEAVQEEKTVKEEKAAEEGKTSEEEMAAKKEDTVADEITTETEETAIETEEKAREDEKILEKDKVVEVEIGVVDELVGKQSLPHPSCENSFATDAEGNGSVAEAIGETLDKCANAIDEMVSELERSSENKDELSIVSDEHVFSEHEIEISEDGSVVSEEHEIAEESDTPSKADVDDGGATILESIKSKKDEELKTSTVDSWEVVDGEEPNSDDEALALATQLIGSNLYKSDLSRSGEMLSTLSGSGSSANSSESSGSLESIESAVSMASSVPTNVGSIDCSEAQRSRWSVQLQQLGELGFEETRCVEILERLAAANIGVGSEDEVTVAQVVNELLK